MWTALKYLLAGALFWFVGALLVGSSQGFVKRSEPAQLIVLQMDTRQGSNGTTFRPTFGLVTTERPRPEYFGSTWMRPAPHQTGDIVAGRYDAVSGEMRSDHMISRSGWMGSIAQLLGIFAILQGILIFFGMPEVLMPLRVRLGR